MPRRPTILFLPFLLGLNGCAYSLAANDPSLPTVFLWAGLVFAFIGGVTAGFKNRSEVGWSNAGLWLGPIALLVIFLDKIDPSGETAVRSDGYHLRRYVGGIALLALPIGFLLLVDMDYQSGQELRYEQYIEGEATLREREREREEQQFWTEVEIERRRQQMQQERRSP